MHDNNSKLSPAPTGQLIKKFARSDREEVLFTIEEYKGHKYLNLRVWALLSDGQWWPTKKGITIRLGEARELSSAIDDVMDYLEDV